MKLSNMEDKYQKDYNEYADITVSEMVYDLLILIFAVIGVVSIIYFLFNKIV